MDQYNRGIGLHQESGDKLFAYGLCFELASALTELGHVGNALNFYQRAAEASSNDIMQYIKAREKVAECYIDIGKRILVKVFRL